MQYLSIFEIMDLITNKVSSFLSQFKSKP